MNCATANVQTLLPHQESRSYAQVAGIPMRSKIAMLESQFISHSIDVVGIQEGRSTRTEQVEGQSYTMLAAAADSGGNLGVQLWD